MALTVQFIKIMRRTSIGVNIQILDGTTVVNQQFIPIQANMDIVLKNAAQTLLDNSASVSELDTVISTAESQVK